jgi:hypothetical protein
LVTSFFEDEGEAMIRSMECDMARIDVAVKLDARVAKEAKMVAAARGVTLAEYISEILRPIVRGHLEDETSKMLGAERPKRPKKAGPAQGSDSER